MNPITELSTFTRSELQGLKAEMERAQLKREIDSTVHQIHLSVVSNARQGKTTYFKHMILPENTEDRLYSIILTVIDELSVIFPDVSIKYDTQTCIRTGKKMNQGIYVDWS